MAASHGTPDVLVGTPRGWRKVGRYAVLVVLGVVVLFPIYAVVLQALKTGPEIGRAHV